MSFAYKPTVRTMRTAAVCALGGPQAQVPGGPGNLVSAERDDFLLLRRLAPEDHGLTVFDADTQETSYGTLVVDGVPLIFDTHRKEASYVSTAEILTETVAPAGVTPEEAARFAKIAEHAGVQALPYSA